jgi:hypothetical protein
MKTAAMDEVARALRDLSTAWGTIRWAGAPVAEDWSGKPGTRYAWVICLHGDAAGAGRPLRSPRGQIAAYCHMKDGSIEVRVEPRNVFGHGRSACPEAVLAELQRAATELRKHIPAEDAAYARPPTAAELRRIAEERRKDELAQAMCAMLDVLGGGGE